tara:strand:+ start:144 stop:395 length:252 start_codon:yes stop_codon:yes gene_type:complete
MEYSGSDSYAPYVNEDEKPSGYVLNHPLLGFLWTKVRTVVRTPPVYSGNGLALMVGRNYRQANESEHRFSIESYSLLDSLVAS